jgi:hypothetical protein
VVLTRDELGDVLERYEHGSMTIDEIACAELPVIITTPAKQQSARQGTNVTTSYGDPVDGP